MVTEQEKREARLKHMDYYSRFTPEQAARKIVQLQDDLHKMEAYVNKIIDTIKKIDPAIKAHNIESALAQLVKPVDQSDLRYLLGLIIEDMQATLTYRDQRGGQQTGHPNSSFINATPTLLKRMREYVDQYNKLTGK